MYTNAGARLMGSSRATGEHFKRMTYSETLSQKDFLEDDGVIFVAFWLFLCLLASSWPRAHSLDKKFCQRDETVLRREDQADTAVLLPCVQQAGMQRSEVSQ